MAPSAASCWIFSNAGDPVRLHTRRDTRHFRAAGSGTERAWRLRRRAEAPQAPCGTLSGARHLQRRTGNRGRGLPRRSSRATHLAAHLDHAGWASFRARCAARPRGDDIVSRATAFDDATKPAAGAARHREQRLERLIDRLPERLQTTIHWLRRPALRWARVPAGVLFIAGSFLSILPLFGLWMLPLGLMLLAEDIPPLRRVRDRFLDWIERHRPHWFASSDVDGRMQPSTTRSLPVTDRLSSAGPHH
jgi:hypothetical protein